ncbi:unnamed protein product, partial [Schistosoma rodhaini]
MLSDDVFVSSVVLSNLGIEISHQNGQVLGWAILEDRLQPIVELVFSVLIVVVGQRIALDDVHCKTPSLCFEGGSDDPWSMRFPSYKCILCFSGQHQCNSLCMWGIFFFMTG